MGRGKRTGQAGVLLPLSSATAGRNRRLQAEPPSRADSLCRLARASQALSDGVVPVVFNQTELLAQLECGEQSILCWGGDEVAATAFTIPREARGVVIVCGGKARVTMCGLETVEQIPLEERTEARLFGNATIFASGQVKVSLYQQAQATVGYGAHASFYDDSRGQLSAGLGGGYAYAHDRAEVVFHAGTAYADGDARVLIPRFHVASGRVLLADRAELHVRHKRKKGPAPLYRVEDLRQPVEIRRERQQYRKNGWGAVESRAVCVLKVERWLRQ